VARHYEAYDAGNGCVGSDLGPEELLVGIEILDAKRLLGNGQLPQLVLKQAKAYYILCWFWPGFLRRTSSAATGSVGDLVRVVRGA